MHFDGSDIEKLIFQLLNKYGLSNKLITRDKYIRSMLTFDLSAKVAHVGLPSIHFNIFSQ